MEVKQIGNCMLSGNRDNPNPGRVYDSSELSPCLTDMQGGGRQPHVVEVKKMVNEIGFWDNGTGKHQSNTVYSENGVSPSITTINGGGTQQIKVLDAKKIKIRQATKDGFIDCEIGGGGGFGLSNISNTQRSSARKRTDLPNFDNGEYP